jgi:serine/threonine-protein kinase
VVAVAAVLLVDGRDSKPAATAAAPTGDVTPTTARSRTVKYGVPQQLFAGLDMPRGVVVDQAGDIYVADAGNHRVLKYPPGATTGAELPFGDVFPTGVAVDTSDSVYVIDTDRILKLAPGAGTPTQLPFGQLATSDGLAVDSAGAVYVTSTDTRTGTGQVLKLAPGATTAAALPFPGLQSPEGVKVDDAGAVYVTDFDKRAVYKLAKNATRPTELPFGDREWMYAVAVDSSSGTVYVTQIDLDDNVGRVFALPAGAANPIELPFTGLQWPQAVTVDSAGNVFVADGEPNGGTGRIVKLPIY